MDSAQAAEELRRKRLHFLLGGPADSACEASGVASITESDERPVASSTLLSTASPPPPVASTSSPALASFANTSTRPAPAVGDSATTTTAAVVCFISGSDAQDLLQSMTKHLMSVVPMASSNNVSAVNGTAAARPVQPSRNPLTERHLPRAIKNHSRASSEDDDNPKSMERSSRPNNKACSSRVNWREQALPSTSSAGVGDENMPPKSASKRGTVGWPKGSRDHHHDDEDDDDDDEDDDFNCGSDNNACSRRMNWRKQSLPSTSSAGPADHKSPRKPSKRKPGRPKGSKNKKSTVQQSESQADQGFTVCCHICGDDDDDEQRYCITDCGHLFHSKCLEEWTQASLKRYKKHKICPFCGSPFEQEIPFFR